MSNWLQLPKHHHELLQDLLARQQQVKMLSTVVTHCMLTCCSSGVGQADKLGYI